MFLFVSVQIALISGLGNSAVGGTRLGNRCASGSIPISHLAFLYFRDASEYGLISLLVRHAV